MSEIQFNERGALPSASSMSRIFNCPASFKMNLSETPESSASADEGTMLHRVCELFMWEKIKGLDSEELKEFQDLSKALTDEQDDAIAFAINEVCKIKEAVHNIYLEKRLWAKSRLYSGKGDVIFVSGDNAKIFDYKFGRGEVERAENNYQLAALAVLVADNFENVKNIEVVIIQPRALEKSKRITRCFYDANSIEIARLQLDIACKEAVEAETPKQNCGHWCKYCKSAYRCLSAQKEINRQMSLATSPAGLGLGVHNVRKEFELCKQVEAFVKARLEKISQWVNENPDGAEIAGIALKAGSKRAKLGNANDIFCAVKNVGISPEEFVGVCDVGMTKLSNLYHEKRKIQNEKQTKKTSEMEVKNLLSETGLLTYSQTEPSLTLVERAE